jgi:hypothetical protein
MTLMALISDFGQPEPRLHVKGLSKFWRTAAALLH